MREQTPQDRLQKSTRERRRLSLFAGRIDAWRECEDTLARWLEVQEKGLVLSSEEEALLIKELSALYPTLDELTQLLLPQDPANECNALLCTQGHSTGGQWARNLARMYVAWGEASGVIVRRFDEVGWGSFTELYLELEKAETFGWLREEAGTHVLYVPGLSKPTTATVEVWPSNEERDQEAMHNPNIETVITRSMPPQPRNEAIARERGGYTRSIVQDDRPGMAELRARRWVQAEIIAGSREQREVIRQEKRRTYSLQEDKLYVRDHRTGLEDGDPSAVLQGQLGPFLRALRLHHLAPLRDVYMMKTSQPEVAAFFVDFW